MGGQRLSTGAPGRRWLALGAAMIAGAVVALVIAAAIAAVWRPASPLTSDLPTARGWAAASAAFDDRVRHRFPPGTPLYRFASELDAQGFAPSWYEPDGDYGAVRHESDFPCEIVARIVWRPGPAGQVARIRGSYREEGCL